MSPPADEPAGPEAAASTGTFWDMDDARPILALSHAWDFAARRHIDQRRKGARGEPYLNHLAEVANLLAEATEGRDLTLVIAGVLHDTVEDTETTTEEIGALFGDEVAGLVAEVTDDKSLAKATRKRLQVDSTPHKSARARMLKLADKTSNLRAITESPPADWSRARLAEYLDWAVAVVTGCRGVNSRLERRFDEAHAAAKASLSVAAHD